MMSTLENITIAEPLVESLALHDLIDPRLGDSYDPYELYHMAKTAYLCVKVDPEKRPSMGEVVQLLEGETEHFKTLTEQFIPHFNP
uniref:Protein kinase domain-containing protein n=1 Tax=Helianthus annuus TaxID=4232 RepID=A0A251TWA8_HELAN